MKNPNCISLLAGVLALTLLTGCVGNPSSQATEPTEKTTKVREVPASDSAAVEADLALCKAAIENVQSNDYIRITEDNRFHGENVMNPTATVSFIKSGEDLYSSTLIPEDGMLDGVPIWSSEYSILCKNGVYYNNILDGYDTIENGVYRRHWGKSTLSPEEDAQSCKLPWLLSFDWNAQEIQYISTVTIDGQKAVKIQIMGAYLPDTICESYTADFFFNKDNQLDRVELVASYALAPQEGMEDAMDFTINVTNTQKVLSTDQSHLTEMMENLYEEALDDAKNKPDDSEEIAP